MTIDIKRRLDKAGRPRFTAQYSTASGWRSAGTYGDRRVAEKAARREEEKATRADWIDPHSGKVTLATYAEQVWIPSIARETATKTGYLFIWNKYLRPAFGDVPLARILPSQIDKWIASMEAEGRGRATANANFRILRLILNRAVRDGVITLNPANSCRPLPVAAREIEIYSPEQWTRFITAAEEPWRSLFLVACGTGLRASELRGLVPLQINWLKRQVTVDRSIVQVKSRYNDGEGWAEKDYPKSRHPRKVPLTEDVILTLLDRVELQGLTPDSDSLLFWRFTAKEASVAMKEISAKAGVPERRMHDLRSTYASWRLKESGDLIRVQQEMGHASVVTTQKYLAVVEETVEDNVLAFEELRKLRRA